jgi:wobble nucleotide-excising tRNase
VSLDKIDELGSCLADLGHKQGLNMNAIFDVDSALKIKDAVEKGLKELREHEKEYNRFVEAAKKDIDNLEKEAKNNQENLDDLGQKIRAIEKTVEEHKYHNIKEEIELYIEEKIDGAEETSIKALTEACKKSL